MSWQEMMLSGLPYSSTSLLLSKYVPDATVPDTVLPPTVSTNAAMPDADVPIRAPTPQPDPLAAMP